MKDVQLAADVLRPVYDELDGLRRLRLARGRCPSLAHDTEATLEQAREYWQRVDRPNVMIKIPGTTTGLPAIEQCDLRGHQHQRHAAVLGRGVRERGRGLHPRPRAAARRRRATSRRPLGRQLLRLAGRQQGGQAARGARAAPTCSGARACGTRARRTFASSRSSTATGSPSWPQAGAPVQRPLWASTGVKNPQYSDTMYVDGLVAPDDGQHDADADAAGRRREGRDHGRDSRRRRGRGRGGDEAAGGRRHRHGARSIEKLLERGRRAVRRRDGEADRGRRERTRGGRHRPSGDVRVEHPGRARAGDRRAGQAGGRARRSRAASGARTRRSGAAPARPRSATGSGG